MVDPWGIIIIIFVSLGALYYRDKYKKLQKHFDDIFHPKPVEMFKSKKTLEREAYEIIRSQILLRDHFRCRECGYYKHLEVHHIIPRRLGGTDDPSNLITLCTRCHAKKHPENGRQKTYSRKQRHTKRNRRKRRNRWLNKNKNVFSRDSTFPDEPPVITPIDASPERRRELYKMWERDELNQGE